MVGTPPRVASIGEVQSIRDVMTPDPVTLAGDSTAVEAARVMRDEGVGDGIVVESDGIRGILTDRDITVRGVALGRHPVRSGPATPGEGSTLDTPARWPATPSVASSRAGV